MSDLPENWVRHKHLRNRLLLMFFFGPVVLAGPLLLLPGSILLSNGFSIAFGVLNLFFLVLFLVDLVALSRWLCPRCGERFYSWRHGLGIFARRCFHCGLLKYSVDS
jgi:hypothetical protein